MPPAPQVLTVPELLARNRELEAELQVCRVLEEQMARALGWWERDLAFWRNRVRTKIHEDKLISEIPIP